MQDEAPTRLTDNLAKCSVANAGGAEREGGPSAAHSHSTHFEGVRWDEEGVRSDGPGSVPVKYKQ